MRSTFTERRVLAGLVGAGVIGAGFWLVRGTSVPAWVAFLLACLAAGAVALAYHLHVRGRTALADTQRQHQRASDTWLATVEALARAIEARARSSRTDIRREQAYAVEMAKAFGIPAQEVEGVRMAALLHDVGKLGVPDHILTKKGPLTPEEIGKVRIHSQLGADIIAHVPFPYPVASLVLCHHERWDGSGYPAGLSGSDIPLGARILSVVDHFVSLTSDRPFRKAVSRGDAIEALWREAGGALDPVVVARFVELLPSLDAAFETAAPAGMRLHATGATREHPHHAGISESHASVFDEIALAQKELYALYEVAQGLGTSLGVADSMGVVAGKLRDLVPFASCALFLYDTAEGVARCRFAIGTGAAHLRQMELRVGSGLIGRVIATRECRVNEDPGDDFLSIGVPADGQVLKSALVCPLIVAERMIGALAMYHTEPRFFTEDHHRLALRVTAQVSAVIHNSVLFERTHEEAVTDQLTGLPNNRFLILHLTRELARARRLTSSVAVLLLDLDNLKDINDSYGHPAGDRALREVASVLRRAIRPYDVVSRYGGDEFIVLLSDCGIEDAEAKRVELQQVVDALPFVVRGTQRVRLAVSIGAAVFPRDGGTYEALLAVADQQMYRDKSQRKRLTPAPTGIPTAFESGSIADVDLRRAAEGVL
ncbi:MAG: diguanylate cyclase [Acidobacteria bacterium]|nr:diguanylate cyclase [Acidobacteriota bacterium]